MILPVKAGRIGCVPGERTMILPVKAGRIGCVPGERTMIIALLATIGRMAASPPPVQSNSIISLTSRIVHREDDSRTSCHL